MGQQLIDYCFDFISGECRKCYVDRAPQLNDVVIATLDYFGLPLLHKKNWEGESLLGQASEKLLTALGKKSTVFKKYIADQIKKLEKSLQPAISAVSKPVIREAYFVIKYGTSHKSQRLYPALWEKYTRGKTPPFECPICIENINSDDKIVVDCCIKPFHTQCLEQWREHKNECPLCREDNPQGVLILPTSRKSIKQLYKTRYLESDSNESGSEDDDERGSTSDDESDESGDDDD